MSVVLLIVINHKEEHLLMLDRLEELEKKYIELSDKINDPDNKR